MSGIYPPHPRAHKSLSLSLAPFLTLALALTLTAHMIAPPLEAQGALRDGAVRLPVLGPLLRHVLPARTLEEMYRAELEKTRGAHFGYTLGTFWVHLEHTLVALAHLLPAGLLERMSIGELEQYSRGT